ncbi:MAG: polysaccharide biosynthesis protein [Clostridiales bacterium]|nr:polysaccharide biosynthesis protein [Clostridiales bacterium]
MRHDAPDVKKRSMASGVALLTVSNLLVNAAGLFFKIPMNRTVGDLGMGYYNAAASIYALFYMISTAGLPVALSVTIAQARSAGNVRGAKQIERRAHLLFLLFGGTFSALMFFGAGPLASLIRSEAAEAAVRAAAPTVLFISVSSAIRGLYQGCGNMTPTAVSQLIEAAGKLFFGVGGALWAIRCGCPTPQVAAAASAGLTAGSFFGMLFLLAVRLLRGDRDLLRADLVISNADLRVGDTLRQLGAIALPVTLSAAVMSLSSMIDTVSIQRLLRASGMGAEHAAALYGNYTSLAVPMFNLPPVFVYPVAAALTPSLAADLAEGDRESACVRIRQSLRYAAAVGIPSSVGLAVLAEPILSLLYRAESARVATPLLVLLAPSSFLLCILAVTNACLHATGDPQKLVISMAAGACVKAVSGIFLLGRFGIAGAPLSTFFCYLTVTAMNLAFLFVRMGKGAARGRDFAVPLGCAALCGLAARFVFQLTVNAAGGNTACLLAIGCAVLVYAASMLLMGGLSRDEIAAVTGRLSGKLRKTPERKRYDRQGTERKAARGGAA